MNTPLDDELIQKYLEGDATPAEERQFRRLLADQSFRRRVAEYALDHGQLCEHARQGMLERLTVQRDPRLLLRRRQPLAIVVVVASILIALGSAWYSLRHGLVPDGMTRGDAERLADRGAELPSPEPASASPASPGWHPGVVRVGYRLGQVIVRKHNPTRESAVDVGTELCVGDVLRTIDSESSALLEFDDGTIVTVAGDTEVSYSLESEQKRVSVARGDITAQVASQPESKPMMFVTPVAEAEVLGTRFLLFADASLTELTVQDGHVLLRRLADRHTVDVVAGQYAVAAAESDMVAQPIQSIPSVWEEDFVAGLPPRWRDGVWIRGEFLASSNGAVRAAARDEKEGERAGPCYVMTAKEWSRGLFRIDEDSHLNLRYRMKTPGWFYIAVSTRSDDSLPSFTGTFIFKTPELRQIRRNEWQTKSIPLNGFRRPDQGQSGDARQQPPQVNDIVFTLFFRTQDEDPGLLIDRMWVTHGPSENAEVLGQSD